MHFTRQFLILAVASELAVAGWQEWYSKGRQLAFEGRAAEARPLLLAALRDVEKRAPAGDLAAITLHELGLVSLDLGRNVEARQYLSRCLALRRALGETADEETGKILNALAMANLNAGKRQEADRLLAQSLVIFETHVGHDHRDYAIALHNLGELRTAQDRFDEAAAYFQQAMLILERTAGPRSLEMVKTLASLAAVQSRLGRHPQAESCSARALQTVEESFAEMPGLLARVLFLRAEVLKTSGRGREGKALERQAKALSNRDAQLTGASHVVDTSALKLMRESGR